MKLIKHLLDAHGRHIVSVPPDTTVLEAITLMADKTIGSLDHAHGRQDHWVFGYHGG